MLHEVNVMSHALVILCGGKSTRIGTDKALLPFGDCCLIEYLVRKFQPDFPKIYLSVQQKNDYAHLNLPVTCCHSHRSILSGRLSVPMTSWRHFPQSILKAAFRRCEKPCSFINIPLTGFMRNAMPAISRKTSWQIYVRFH